MELLIPNYCLNKLSMFLSFVIDCKTYKHNQYNEYTYNYIHKDLIFSLNIYINNRSNHRKEYLIAIYIVPC